MYLSPPWFASAYQVLNLDPSPNRCLPGNRFFLAQHPQFNRAGLAASLRRVLAWDIDAVDDRDRTPQNTPVTTPVLQNDLLDGRAVDPATVQVSELVPPTNGSIVVNDDGTITYTPNPGFWGEDSYEYQICERANPTNCTTAIATVLVQGPVGALLAVDDTGGPVGPEGRTRLLNVFANDTFNSAVLDPAQVNFVPVATNALTFSADGWVDVAAGLAPGSYSTTYTLCLVSQPTVCDVGTVTVTVIAAEPGVVAEDDRIDMKWTDGTRKKQTFEEAVEAGVHPLQRGAAQVDFFNAGAQAGEHVLERRVGAAPGQQRGLSAHASQSSLLAR